MEKTAEKHFERIRDRLQSGRLILHKLASADEPQQTFDVPGVRPDPKWKLRTPPRVGDVYVSSIRLWTAISLITRSLRRWFLATDERSTESLAYARSLGAVLINDIMTEEDWQIGSWPLLLTDVLALVEQAVLAQADYFYGHLLSSVAGGVLNMRAARGADPRTSLVD